MLNFSGPPRQKICFISKNFTQSLPFIRQWPLRGLLANSLACLDLASSVFSRNVSVGWCGGLAKALADASQD